MFSFRRVDGVLSHCSTGVTIYAIDVSLESSLGLVPTAHAIDASLEPSQVLASTSTPSSKANRHAIDAKCDANHQTLLNAPWVFLTRPDARSITSIRQNG